jgi:hypothetical protein
MSRIIPTASDTLVLHLVGSDSAAGGLRAACTGHGLPGRVISCADDLTHGPLVEGEARLALERALQEVSGERAGAPLRPFAAWQEVLETLDRSPGAEIIVWGGENLADRMLLAMSCHRLAGRHEPLWRMQVPGVEHPHVPTHSPEELASLYAKRQRLSDEERRALAAEFVRIRERGGSLRRLQEGSVIDVAVDSLDPLLLAACNTDWQPAARGIGSAMGRCDGPNLMSDGFLALRVRALVEAGRIERRDESASIRDSWIRLV